MRTDTLLQAVRASQTETKLPSPDLHWVRDETDLEAIRPIWNRLVLEDTEASPFMEYDWIRLWWETFGRTSGLKLNIPVLSVGGVPFAIAPLCVGPIDFWGFRIRGVRSMTNDHSNRFGFIRGRIGAVQAESNWVVEQIIAGLFKSGERPAVTLFQDIPADSSTTTCLEAIALRAGAKLERWPSLYSPFVPLDKGWVSVLKSLRSHFRSELKRREKRVASDLGMVSMESVTGREGLSQALSDMFRIEMAGWKGREGTAMASTKESREFYSRLSWVAADRGWLSLDFLVSKGQRIAFGLHLKYRGRLYLLKTSFDQNFSQYAPGHLFLRYRIERACEEGVHVYDFVGQRDSYKLSWARQVRRHDWIYLFDGRVLPSFFRWTKFRVLPAVKTVLRRTEPQDSIDRSSAPAGPLNSA